MYTAQAFTKLAFRFSENALIPECLLVRESGHRQGEHAHTLFLVFRGEQAVEHPSLKSQSFGQRHFVCFERVPNQYLIFCRDVVTYLR